MTAAPAERRQDLERLRDVARVVLGPAAYGFDVRYNDEPVAGVGVQLLPGANALEVAKRVKAKMAELESTFPAGVEWFIPYDSTAFILVSIKEVLITLVAAVVLVFIVMLVFLQSIRATLIPTLVVPAALMGAFIGMYAAGFSINQLTLFGMVLAIGIVVDDAIVVIEAVERIMREENLSPREATRKAMGQITGAIVTITVVLMAVFVPSALLGGATGAIYRQFALTIAVSMAFSAFLALSFTPALCAHMLKPTHLKLNPVFRWFNRAYDRSQSAYLKVVADSVRHTPRWMIAFAVLVGEYRRSDHSSGHCLPRSSQAITRSPAANRPKPINPNPIAPPITPSASPNASRIPSMNVPSNGSSKSPNQITASAPSETLGPQPRSGSGCWAHSPRITTVSPP